MKIKNHIWIVFLAIIFLIVSVYGIVGQQKSNVSQTIRLEALPSFSGEPYVIVYDNQPEFSVNDISVCSFERYSELDILNRCGYAITCIGRDIMPTEERGSIGQIKPTGWQTIKYDFIDGKYLYNRCHLIGYQLTGENANERNLITGTRFMNVEGMLPFENMVTDYVKETGNHVMYRVTPVFWENELVARGVQMEALSVEDDGYGICFNVYVYNNQPGVEIDYATGESVLSTGNINSSETSKEDESYYILNIKSMNFHHNSCEKGRDINAENIKYYDGDRDVLIKDGYSPAGCCNP